ncbi:MAG: flagellin [Candidatus Sericytochromatia bacterium]|nr:flagellin [Candidatus Sericytochromatia bacterium]
MAIRINTNLASLSAQRNLGTSNQQLNKTLERLSSGLRINRAADDAAGLAVSEKLRTQIKGFNQATANAQDAINLISTAESGLDQTSQILQRMRELSIQSANDTLVNTDRAKIQEEINQLRLELTRIAETTEYNTRTLLDGSIANATAKVDPVGEIKQNLRVGNTGSNAGLSDFFEQINSAFIAAQPQGIAFENNRLVLYTIGNVVVDVEPTVDVAFEFKIVSYQANSSAPVSVAINVYNSISGFLYSVDPLVSASFSDQGGLEGFAVGHLGQTQALLDLPVLPPPQGNNVGFNMGYVAISNALTLSDIGKSAVIQITPRRDPVTTDSALTFHVGANEGQFLKMGVQDMRAKALRMETLTILGSTDQDSRLKSQNAIGAIDAALDYVNTNRSRLGAFQNRLEYTIQNLQVSKENLTASESRIRDADIAAETANLTRAQILVQAGTSILSQANVAPQSALNLLRG